MATEEQAQSQNEQPAQWPVLPKKTDIVVKCAPLENPAKQAEELLASLLTEKKVNGVTVYAVEPKEVDGEMLTTEQITARLTDYLDYCTKALRKIDERRLAYGAPAREFTTDLNAEVKRYTDRISAGKTRASQVLLKIEQDRQKAERERQEAQRKKDEEEALAQAQQLQEHGNTQAAERVLEVASSAPRPRPPVGGGGFRGASTGKKLATKKTWKGEVSDVKAICRAIADGKLSTDGVAFGAAWLNAIAAAHEKEEVYLGVKCAHVETLA